MIRIVCLLALLVWANVAHAATYYVATTGSDITGDGSEIRPWQTLGFSVRKLRSGGGDELIVRGGSYPERLERNVPHGVSWDSKTRIAAYPGEVVWLVPVGPGNGLSFGRNGITGQQQAYIEIDGINVDCAKCDNDIVKINWADGWYAHHIRLKNLELVGRHDAPTTHVMGVMMTGGGVIPGEGSTGFNEFINVKIHRVGRGRFDQALYVSSADNLFDNVEVYDYASGGIEIFNQYIGPSAPARNIVRNSRVHSPYSGGDGQGRRGILTCGNGSLIERNTVENLIAKGEEDTALWVYCGDDQTLSDNTIRNNAGCGIVVGYDSVVNRTGVVNNVSTNNGMCVGPSNYWDRLSLNTTVIWPSTTTEPAPAPAPAPSPTPAPSPVPVPEDYICTVAQQPRMRSTGPQYTITCDPALILQRGDVVRVSKEP